MNHPDPNRKKEPCKKSCSACKTCQERAKFIATTSSDKTRKPAPKQ